MSFVRIVGLDLGGGTGNVGIAVFEGDKITKVEAYKPSEGDSLYRAGQVASRVLSFKVSVHHDVYAATIPHGTYSGKTLMAQIVSLGTVVFVEGYGFASKRLVPTVELGTVVRYFLRQNDVPYVEIAPNSLKKFVTGSGQAKKEHMLLHVYKHWGIEPKTHDEADAIGLAHYGAAVLGLIEMPKPNMAPVRNTLKSEAFVRLTARWRNV